MGLDVGFGSADIDPIVLRGDRENAFGPCYQIGKDLALDGDRSPARYCIDGFEFKHVRAGVDIARVRLSRLRLLDEPLDAAAAVRFDDAELARVSHGSRVD